MKFFGIEIKMATKDTMKDFVEREKNRREEAETFLQFSGDVLSQVGSDLYGNVNGAVQAGKSVVFRPEENCFYFIEDVSPKAKKEVGLLELRGKDFWEAVQQVMNFMSSLNEDLKRRDQGRNNLVSDMSGLARQIAKNQAGYVRRFL